MKRTPGKPTPYKRYQVSTYHAPFTIPICEEVADIIEDGLKRGVDYGLPVFVVKPKKPRRRG